MRKSLLLMSDIYLEVKDVVYYISVRAVIFVKRQRHVGIP
jgi:hypothetical protein